MKKNTWKWITISVMAGVFFIPFQIWAQPMDIPVETLQVGEVSETGYIPVFTEGLQYGTGNSSLRKATEIPAQYDLREQGLVTSVKDQGSANLCWAYSALASAESGFIKDQVTDTAIDLSEYHLGWTTYNGTNADIHDTTGGETFLPQSGQTWLSNGGNRYYSTGTLARWYGVELERNIGTTPTASCQKSSVSHVDQIYYLPEFNLYTVENTNQTHTGYQESARNLVKQTLMEQGAIEVGINMSNTYYDTTTNSYYCNDSSNCTANHSVVLVGWDDAYKTRAEEAGAWIFKNSWGTSVGEEGYYWVSYCDMSLDNPTFYEFEDSVNGNHAYSNLYQYDGTGGGLSQYYMSSKLTGANVFTAVQGEAIGEVGFYTMQANTQYTIRVYTDLAGSTPDTGTCAVTVSGSESYAGYHTVELTEMVTVSAGEKIAVEVEQISDGVYRVPIEEKNSSSRQTTVHAGESFVGNSQGWTDVMELKQSNVCIKAFGNTVEVSTDTENDEDTNAGEDTNTDTGKDQEAQPETKPEIKPETKPQPQSPVKTPGYWVLDSQGWWYNNGNGTWPANCWTKINGTWYAFNAAGYMRTGWFLDGGTWYYLNGSGAMQTGWLLNGNTWYYLNESGAMQTGWLLDGSTWYYMNRSGAMQTGWLLDSGTWYYLNRSGAMQMGWLLDGSTWYYMNRSGAMQTGWYQAGGVWYYSYSSGAMAANTWIGSYYVDGSGAWRP